MSNANKQMTENINQFSNNNYSVPAWMKDPANGFINIDDWFDDFLERSGDYFQHIYLELLKFESQFSNLKEFVAWVRIIVIEKVEEQLGLKVGAHKIINSITELMPNTSSAFEHLIAKWVVARGIFDHSIILEKNALSFYGTIKTIVERDTKNFDVEIEIFEIIQDHRDNFYYEGIGWRLINKPKRVPEATKESSHSYSHKQIAIAYYVMEIPITSKNAEDVLREYPNIKSVPALLRKRISRASDLTKISENKSTDTKHLDDLKAAKRLASGKNNKKAENDINRIITAFETAYEKQYQK